MTTMETATITLSGSTIGLEWPEGASWVHIDRVTLQSAIDTANGAQRALDLHVEGPSGGYCDHCHRPYPCPTVRSLEE